MVETQTDPHGNLQDRGAGCTPPPPTQQPSRVNAQRTPDWTPVTTAAETHVPASPSCGVATWATSYQAPKTAKLPLWGGPPAARRWSGSQNASCFFGRTLRNVHFGNARSTPSDALFCHLCPLGAAHHHFSHQSSGPLGGYALAHTLLTHAALLSPSTVRRTGRGMTGHDTA